MKFMLTHQQYRRRACVYALQIVGQSSTSSSHAMACRLHCISAAAGCARVLYCLQAQLSWALCTSTDNQFFYKVTDVSAHAASLCGYSLGRPHARGARWCIRCSRWCSNCNWPACQSVVVPHVTSGPRKACSTTIMQYCKQLLAHWISAA